MPASHGSKLASKLASSIWGGFSGANRNRNPKRSRAVSQSGLQWNDWLVVWNMALVTFHILRMSSSQLLLTHIFQRGWNHQPGDLICWNYLNPSTAKSFCLEVVSINFQTNSDYRRCDLQVLPGHFLLGGFARNWATPNPWIYHQFLKFWQQGYTLFWDKSILVNYIYIHTSSAIQVQVWSEWVWIVWTMDFRDKFCMHFINYSIHPIGRMMSWGAHLG